MPQLTWPWVLVFCVALFAAFFWVSTWLRKQQMSGSKPRPRHSASTTEHVSLRPTLGQRVITQATGHPPWEPIPDLEETPNPGSRTSWPPSPRKKSKEEAFDEELDQVFLTAPPAKLQDPLPFRHNELHYQWWLDETPSTMQPPTVVSMKPVTVVLSQGMPVACLINPDLTVPAGEIQWKASPVIRKRMTRTILTIEHQELVLF